MREFANSSMVSFLVKFLFLLYLERIKPSGAAENIENKPRVSTPVDGCLAGTDAASTCGWTLTVWV